MELDLKDYLKIIRKRIWIVIALVLVSCLATGIISFYFINPVYEASTKLIVNKSSDRVGMDQLDLNSVNLNIRLIDTYKEIIKTTRIMEKVANEHPEFNLTAAQLIQKVRVSSVNNTQVMTLAVQDPSYEKAVQIVNAVSYVFKDEIPQIYMVDNVSILNEARMVDHPSPVKPNKKLNIAISFVVSLMTAVGIIFLLEYLDDTIKTEADVQQVLGLPTLALITRMKDEDMATHTTVERRKLGEKANVTVNQ